jgi:hypothetical protein
LHPYPHPKTWFKNIGDFDAFHQALSPPLNGVPGYRSGRILLRPYSVDRSCHDPHKRDTEAPPVNNRARRHCRLVRVYHAHTSPHSLKNIRMVSSHYRIMRRSVSLLPSRHRPFLETSATLSHSLSCLSLCPTTLSNIMCGHTVRYVTIVVCYGCSCSYIMLSDTVHPIAVVMYSGGVLSSSFR